jgi:molybdate transport system substrate-binding protein
MKIRGKLGILGLATILSLSIVGCSTKDNEQVKKENTQKVETVELNISAAASLKEAMAELEREYKKDNKNINLTVNFGASGSLQQQIEQGAPCDVFISAGKKQMDALEKGELLLKDTYKDLVKNDLVLISPKDSEITSIDDLNTNKVAHIGLGEPNSVPAGKYADEVLTNLNIKDSLKDKLVFAKDVKEVLAWTVSKNADVGFVYYSDTINTDGIKVVEKISEDTHSPIIYPIAVIKDSKKSEEAKNFEKFLLSDKAQEILINYGYKSAQ